MSEPYSSILSPEGVAELLKPYGIHLSAAQLDQVRSYIALLLKWNQSVSLTAIEDQEEIVSRHFGESMFLAAEYPVENGRLADLGSGPGFPGLPLKIISPALEGVLIESNKKKCAFLWEVIRTLQL